MAKVTTDIVQVHEEADTRDEKTMTTLDLWV